jgi:hypothetical protein
VDELSHDEMLRLVETYPIAQMITLGPSPEGDDPGAPNPVDVLVRFQPWAAVSPSLLAALQAELSALFDRPVNIVRG